MVLVFEELEEEATNYHNYCKATRVFGGFNNNINSEESQMGVQLSIKEHQT